MNGYICLRYPDGSISDLEHINRHYEPVKRLYRDINVFLRDSQIGICLSEGNSIHSFTPLSQMLGEDFVDHAMMLRDLSKKVKKLEKKGII